MKILWICNTALPCVAKDLGETPLNVEGWRTEIAEMIQNMEDMQLTICFPHFQENEVKAGSVGKLSYYAIKQRNRRKAKYHIEDETNIRTVIEKEKPDLIHIWGSEFPHALAAGRVCRALKLEYHTIVSVQGLVSVYSEHYTVGLPKKMLYSYHPLDLLYPHSINKGLKQFIKRGDFEKELFEIVPNVIGRTDWDRACTLWMNKERKYFFCNETLRKEFYVDQWNHETCKKNSIFVSQAYYSVKGFHFFIEAMRLLVEKFPDLEIHIAGSNFLKRDSLKGWIRSDSYANYTRKLIEKYNLQEHIHFMGSLTADEMKEQYLWSNVFVSPSLIENSPNSVGEAMILGTPVISSDVGGVKNLLIHEKEGFIYPVDEPYMLAYYIRNIFLDADFAKKLSQNAQRRARETHNKVKNFEQLIQIYNSINNMD